MDSLYEVYRRAYPIERVPQMGRGWVETIRSLGTQSVRYTDPSLTGGLVFPKEQYFMESFLKSYFCLMFPIGMWGHLTGFGLRSVQHKGFKTYSTHFLIYTSWAAYRDRGRFRYGTPIVLCEGVKDTEVVSQFWPFTFAYLTAGVSRRVAEFLSYFTNRVLVIPDNDDAGATGSRRSLKNLKRFNIDAWCCPVQHWGDIAAVYEDAFYDKAPAAATELRRIRARIQAFTGDPIC